MNRSKLFVICGLLLLGGEGIAQKASTAIVDYRAWQSPVRNQKDRGTCTAFAVVAAMETFPGVPSDLSEQYIYAQAKMNHYEKMQTYTEGAPLSFYVDVIQSRGTIREEKMPYNPEAPIWDEGTTGFEAMKQDIQGNIVDMLRLQKISWKLDWGLIQLAEGDVARDVDWIKARLDEGVRAIPVGYAVDGDYWSGHPASEERMIHPGEFLMVDLGQGAVPFDVARRSVPDLAAKVQRGEVPASYTELGLKAEEGHAVAIVGYNAQGFLIKNSWGTTWGDGGYGWVSFDYHRIFAGQALAIRALKFQAFEGSDAPVADIQQFALKVTPYYFKDAVFKRVVDGAELSLVWQGQGRPAAVEEVSYVVKDSRGAVVEELHGYIEGIFAGQGGKMGYPANGLNGRFGPQASATYTVEVKGKFAGGVAFRRSFQINGRENREYR